MTQRFSQNGWPAYPTTIHFTRATAECTGDDFGFWAANDDVAVVFREFIERFDREVEKIDGPVRDDWSYANRLVRGSTETVSNHGSATAIDVNALKHPRGVHNTFSLAKQKTIRSIKNSITDNRGVAVLRLGMDFKTTVDDMHVEIKATPLQVKQAADKIRKRDAHVTPPKQEENDMAVELSPADIEKIAQRTAHLVWFQTQAEPLGQTAGGSLSEIDDRTAATNLTDRARDGVAPLLTPLTEALGRIEDKIDALTPAPTQP